MRRAVLFAAAALLAAPAAASPARPPVIVVIVDALRADHMSLYGYGRRTTPRLEAFARDSAVFTQAIAPAPTTLLSFASLFTGLEVPAHGVSSRELALGDGTLTLAEILRLYGYRTGAFLGGHSLHPVFGLDRGFDEYFYVASTSSSFSGALPRALAWIGARAAAGEPFLAVVHGNDLHTPYVFPPQGLYDKGFRVSPGLASLGEADARVFGVYRGLLLRRGRPPLRLTAGDKGHLTARYDEGIRYADGLVGDFLDALRAGGVLDRAVTVVTADHGEGLFDHDYFFHDFSLFDEVLRVPLLVRPPGGAARRESAQVQLTDLLPTLLDYAGISPPEEVQGRSLRPLLEGAPGYEPRPALSVGPFGAASVRAGGWKLILDGGKAALYDLRADPAESRNLAGRGLPQEAELRAVLAARTGAAEGGNPGRLPRGSGFPPGTAEDGAWQEDLFNKLLDPSRIGPAAE